MSYPQPPGWGPPPAPPPSSRTNRVLTVVLVVVFAPILLLGLAGLLIGDSRERALEGVAVTQSLDGFRVCATRDLHSCQIRYGSTAGRDLAISVATIRGVASCDTQQTAAYNACQAVTYENDQNARCQAGWGVIAQTLAYRTDPRQEHLPAGQFAMHCDEGRREGAFANPTF